jgi:hypothetical protein
MGFEGVCKMYKHWKKFLLALTTFFWNACDNGASPAAPVFPDSSSSTTNGQNSSSSIENSSSSSTVETQSSSSSDVQSSSSAESSSSVESSSSSPIAESSSGEIEVVPLYGVYMDKETCTTHQGDNVYECTDGVTCVESTADEEQAPVTRDPTEVTAKYGVVYKPEVTAKYGVVYVKDKVYTCSDGKVYNEAEFRANYNTIIIDETVVLYGPPCAFDGSCGEDK